MPVQPYRPAALTGRIFRGADVVRRGLLTPSQLRSRAWQRIRHDDYADARLERDQKLACRAVMTRLPAGTVLAGPSAAFLLGAGHAAQFTDDIHVITAPAERIGTQRQLRVHHTNVLPGATVDRSGVLLTTATRTAWDCALWLGTAPAVSIVDVLLARGLTTAQALDAQVRRYAGKPGRRRAEKVFGLADPGAQSPPESELRVRFVLGGLPAPATQLPIGCRRG